MIYEFTLSHPILGDLIISEPGGWLTTKLRLERHNDFKSVIEYFGGDDDNAGDFTFYGDNGVINGGIDFIREAIRLYGADTDLFVFIRLSFNGYTFYSVFSGQLALWASRFIPDNKVQIPIIRNNLWTKFTNRLDQPVDIQSETNQDDLPAQVFDSVLTNLTRQKVRQENQAEVSIDEVNSFDAIPDNAYLQIGYGNVILEELDDTYNLPTDYNIVLPVSNLDPEYGGTYRFIINVVSYIFRTVTVPSLEFHFQSVKTFDFDYIDYFLNIDGVEYPFSWSDVAIPSGVPALPLGAYQGGNITHFTIDSTHELTPNSSVRFYGKMNQAWVEPVGADDYVFFHNMNVSTSLTTVLKSDINIIADTIYPASESESFLIHDVAGQITDRIIGQDDTFYSEYLGSGNTLYRQYEADGCGWEFMLLKGLQLRQYLLSEKPFFQSFRQWWNGINPILNLGLGYETVNGVEVIRVEEVEYFYDRSQVSLNISNIREISSSYDEDVTLKTIKNGYKQWQSENISGIDDSQTKHTRASRLQKAGKEMTDESEFIAASLAIETTRRTTRKKSADYKFDDNTFIIAVNPVEISPMNYEPKLDEGFSSITNLLNSETRYNSLITPVRNFFRRLNLYSIGLQDYLTSVFKFTGGEGNYDMTSDYNVSDGCDEQTGIVSEKMDIPVSPVPLHRNEVFEMIVPMEWEDYLSIRDNRNYPIGVSQTDTGHVKMFIKDLTFEPFKSRATINAWTTEFFEIQVIQTEILGKVCDAVVTECEDAYLTENSFELITEDGDCLVLE